MREPHMASADGKGDGGKLCQRDGLGLAVVNLCPGLNHILILIGTIIEIDSNRIHRISQRDDSRYIFLASHLFPLTSDHHLRRQIAIGMLHGESCLSRTVHAIGRIGIHAAIARRLQMGQIIVAEFSAIIDILWLFAVFHIEYHCRVLGMNGHLLSLHRHGYGQEHSEKYCFLHIWDSFLFLLQRYRLFFNPQRTRHKKTHTPCRRMRKM